MKREEMYNADNETTREEMYKSNVSLPPAGGAENIRQLLLGWEHYKRDHFRESDALDVEAILMSEYSQIAAQPQPTAEGAEEILWAEAEDLAFDYDILDRIDDDPETGNIRQKPSLKFMTAVFNLATLHAHKIADKMVEERLREELVKYDHWAARHLIGSGEVFTAEKAVDTYLEELKNVKR